MLLCEAGAFRGTVDYAIGGHEFGDATDEGAAGSSQKIRVGEILRQKQIGYA